MDKVYEELDDAKSEIEKLKAELSAKTDSLENLKKSHDAQVNQIQEAKSKAEKLDQELLQKEEEIAEAKQVCEDLKGNLNRKESIIKHLRAANDKIRVDCDENFKKWEEEKRGLVLALEEANEKTENQEQQIYAYRQEIECLKGSLSVSKKKSFESKNNGKASKETRERDDMFHKLEEEKRKVEDQLKWKKEQFKHLEEAHEKFKDQFRCSKKEWEMEKSTLLDEISSLHNKLDSQIRISDDLQYQLKTCHQALANVESQKKRLQVEVSDLKMQLDNASSEYQDARLQLDSLNSDHDKDIADLRYSLKTKEAYCKESKYMIEKLEQENQELRLSLKELQEAQIQEAGASYSQSKLRSKLKNLENTHKECVSNFKAKEAEWNLKLEQLTGELNSCNSKLEAKIAEVEELKMELERSYSLTIEIKLLNEEMSVMLLVLKQAFSEVQLKLVNREAEMDLINKEREAKIFKLVKQLEIKDASLIIVEKGLNEERDRAACLMRQVESYESNKELQNELDRLKKMLEESTMSQLMLKEKVSEMECGLAEQHNALDCAIIELDERACERNEMEFELEIWKSIVERLKNDLQENHAMRKELEASLLEQVEVGESLKLERDSLVYKLEEKESRLVDLERHLVLTESAVSSELQKEVVESAVIAKGTYEHEKDSLMQLVIGKNIRIDELMQKVTSLEQQFASSLTNFSSELAEKQVQIKLIQDISEKIAASQILAALEIEEKKLMVEELEDEVHAIQQKLILQEEKWSHSEQLALDTELQLGAKQLQAKQLNDQMETKLRNSETMLQKLKMENRNLLENATRLSSEREYLLAFVQELSDKLCELSTGDTQLMDMYRSIVINLNRDDGFLVKENMSIHSPTRTKKPEAISDTRSPFKELNG